LKIAYVVIGILIFFLLSGFVVRMLARRAGIMAAVRGLSPNSLDSIEPRGCLTIQKLNKKKLIEIFIIKNKHPIPENI
jgi:hypothetical protein